MDLSVQAFAESLLELGHELGSSVEYDRSRQSMESKHMFQEKLCELFSRGGVPTVYQVAHIGKSTRDYKYRVVAIQPCESGNKVH